MSSPTKNPPPQKKGGWGSLLSGAVANLERGLDTILADEPDASQRQRASETVIKDATRARTNSGNLGVPSRTNSQRSRDASRTRVNDRLADRLAKATAAKSGGSGAPSRSGTPVNVPSDAGSARASIEVKRQEPAVKSDEFTEKKDASAEQQMEDVTVETNGKPKGPEVAAGDTLLQSSLPLNPAKVSIDSNRPSVEITSTEASARPSIELQNGHTTPPKSNAELEAELEQMRKDHQAAERQRQEEMQTYMEKIDALQAKLKYLAEETVAAAKAANAETGDAAKVAEKDERIALLMEEGEKLSKSEMKHLQTIKKLRAKAGEDEKGAAEVRKKLERAEKAESDLKAKLRKAEVAERQAAEKARTIVAIEAQVEDLRVDRENASELIRTLTAQLKEANDRAKRAESDAQQKAAGNERIAALENELEDAQIEKKLAEDRAIASDRQAQEELDRQKERWSVRELELKNEISGLESRVEAMRARAEDASSGEGGEASVHLLRQVEMLQSQYSLAKENWETIEGSLSARVSMLEKERDEASRREQDVRKKAREATTGRRALEDELEAARDEVRSLMEKRQASNEEARTAQKKAEEAESKLADARAETERQRRLWEVEMGQKLEEERAKWLRQRTESPTTSGRKQSTADLAGLATAGRKPVNRLASNDLHSLHTSTDHRPVSRRSSNMPTPFSTRQQHVHPMDRSSEVSPTISRQESSLSLETPSGMPPTPSIEIDNDLERTSESPGHTINDLVSTSTAGAGPSVQLVERMSAAVRRLESEKATFKDEIARLSQQRDSARDEVVELMREVDAKRVEDGRMSSLEGEVGQLKQRYEASLEMLGEREEEVEELKEDLKEMKRLYRELVGEKMPPA